MKIHWYIDKEWVHGKFCQQTDRALQAAKKKVDNWLKSPAQNLYSVILLDEIEKAPSDVYNILLQVLDDGLLTDGQEERLTLGYFDHHDSQCWGQAAVKDFGQGCWLCHQSEARRPRTIRQSVNQNAVWSQDPFLSASSYSRIDERCRHLSIVLVKNSRYQDHRALSLANLAKRLGKEEIHELKAFRCQAKVRGRKSWSPLLQSGARPIEIELFKSILKIRFHGIYIKWPAPKRTLLRPTLYDLKKRLRLRAKGT